MTSLLRYFPAYPVRDFAETRIENLFGCRECRSARDFADFDSERVPHLTGLSAEHKAHNEAGGEEVSVRHFGVILLHRTWNMLRGARQTRSCVDNPRGIALKSNAIVERTQ